MGVQMDALNHSDSLYVKAVQQFNNLAVLYSQKPYYWFFNNLGWKLAGHEKKTLEVLKVLKDTTDEVRRTVESGYNGVGYNESKFLVKKIFLVKNTLHVRLFITTMIFCPPAIRYTRIRQYIFKN